MYMPGMNGIEICRSLVASKRHLPAILMSGRDNERTRQITRELKRSRAWSNLSMKKPCCARFGWHFGTMKKTEKSPQLAEES
ncbi:response regulator [Candidatus Binatus sp.]|uniref:response regulator n=1 Tax=Candidatus Binatus sp. TaxID=2811406 RepID=UPI003C6FCC05